ncbi:hypothetical protein MLD38_007682 [Melastoma candidum]|uniref:Uncharacterized protein n=1 Tax=Melastoma candidum TaxID=119954 RepID=A0ACB9RS08_9MYRT|nr:hypothetical protein MLD38_007682 [Melastoma candidum]
MCPLRFILVFFSAVLAGYFAWRTVRSSPDDQPSPDSTPDDLPSPKSLSLKKMAGDGFWGFVDMASGRYLWRGIKELRGVPPEDTHPKTS